MASKDKLTIEPSVWMEESLFSEYTGLNKSKLDTLRESIWVEGKHFNKISTTGKSTGRTIMYNRIEFEKFCAQQAAA